ncbi:hypothetical protein GW766_01095 [Candidatus Parcubacteria bacterium]|nr:hypothetical protein [Candidatus Parcubacteria bacterium]
MESFLPTTPEKQPTIDSIALGFKRLLQVEGLNNAIPIPYDQLDQILAQADFTPASPDATNDVLQDNHLLCRSENFSRVLDLLLTHTPIDLENKNYANMCTMSSSSGYRIAMEEGFSGKDVGGLVKVVLSFEGTNIENHGHVSTDNELWKQKPRTAEVSIIGSGVINYDDIKLVSFRFPIRFYPAERLTDAELDLLDAEQIKFVVRHYTQKKAAQ